ncbi:hypothetical protein E5161_17455 [Cohnella pontilimi]|uniref:L,D-TPase catalytic domain-containing protein n=2 Tax=Cohnella pontilimi TaxID=2564100 RepID=A0A4U0F614_9BACL|nr:hypothetical protein E5161_17455 [Cohnella pontilimi]
MKTLLKLCATVCLISALCFSSAFTRFGKPGKPPQSADVSIVINPRTNTLTLYQNNVPIKKYPIALGKPETPTPIGDFKVINKYKNWGSGFGTRWMGLNVPWGIYGIHGTNRPGSIGSDASHGCVRMFNRHVEELYNRVKIGTKVTILGHVLGEPRQLPRRLLRGHTGGDVMLIQNRLRGAGFYHGPCNGKFGYSTEHAVKAFERANSLPADGIVSFREYVLLGLIE